MFCQKFDKLLTPLWAITFNLQLTPIFAIKI